MNRLTPLNPFHHASLTAVGVALLLASAATVQALPRDIPAGSKLVYNFNLIGYPAGQTYDGNCGNGHRIFVNREANHAQVVVQNSLTDWSIVDCNATGDHQAVLATNQPLQYDVYVRILGKPGGHIHICGDTFSDIATGETLCLLGPIDLTRGKQSKFSMAPADLFDATAENILWTVDTNANFRIVQFRVYARP